MSAKRERRRSSKTAPTSLEIRERWPLHWLVWEGRDAELEAALLVEECEREQLDPRGRTPLHLAVVRGKVRCVDVLLRNGGNTLAFNRHNWNVLQECVGQAHPEMIGMALRYRDQQQAKLRSQQIPLMLERLQTTPDYYIEMTWEVSSWVPFLSRMCPSDTYKIWKKGTTVRVDTTLVGFQQLTWQRGNLSFIFKATGNGAVISEVNHDMQTVLEQELKIVERDPVETMMSQEVGVVQRLSAPIVSTSVETSSVSFQRQKSGFWGFRSDKVEDIHGYEAKVFSAAGLEIVSRTRVEHLPDSEKSKHKAVNPLQDFLGAAQDHIDTTSAATPTQTPLTLPSNQAPPPSNQTVPSLAMEEYFQPPKSPKDYDRIGRPVEVTSRVQRLKATVWLAENFPLSLQEQIMPIIDLMALNNSHFAQLKDFISLQMPSGFPVKFEIPLFHVMTARVTFGNINGHKNPAPHISLHMERDWAESDTVTTPTRSSCRWRESGGGVTRRGGSLSEATTGDETGRREVVEEEEERAGVNSSTTATCQARLESHEVCTISEECFAIPTSYRRLARGRHAMADEEDELLQLAIRQSLMERGSGTKEEEPETVVEEEPEVELGRRRESRDRSRQLNEMTLTEALSDSTILTSTNGHRPPPPPPPSSSSLPPPLSNHEGDTANTFDSDLQLALNLSRQQAEEEERRRRLAEEEEELERVLRLSITDK